MPDPALTEDGVSGLTPLWRLTTGDPEICIAVIDGGVDLEHPCLAGAQLTAIDTGAHHAPTRHGTQVASLLFGQHGSAVTGVAPRCRGLIVPVYAPDGSQPPDAEGPGLHASQLDLARAITTAVEQGAHVINISGGEIASSAEPERFLADALRLCAERDVLVIGAAGNRGCECLEIPAAVPTVLAVGGSDGHGAPLAFSNWSDSYRDHGVVFLGRDLIAAVPGGGVSRVTGTSYAAALVSGIAALLLSVQRTLGQPPSPGAIRQVLLDTAAPCRLTNENACERLLRGEVRVPQALTRMVDAATPALVPSQATEDTGMSAIVAQENSDAGMISAPPQGVRASGCGCGGSGGGGAPCTCNSSAAGPAATTDGSLVYVLASIGYDFGTWTRYEWYTQQMSQRVNPRTGLTFGSPLDRTQFIDYLNYIIEDRPGSWESFIWTLEFGSVPVYALTPIGPYASQALERIKNFFQEQVIGKPDPNNPTLIFKSERCSIPGYLTGQNITLMNGLVIPVIAVTDRGMYNWSVEWLIQLAMDKVPDPNKFAAAAMLRQFFEKVYYQLRNLGRTSQDRALNYSGTNVYQLVESIILKRPQDTMTTMIQDIRVEKTPICRPGSDCWDVLVTTFNPEAVRDKARIVTRITIDVSDVVPVTVGPGLSWPEI